MFKILVLLFVTVVGLPLFTNAQPIKEYVADTSLATAMLFPKNNQLGFPLIRVGETEALELHFDDLEAGYKNYFYTYQLCNADWTPGMVTYFDYMKGFTNNRLNTFRISSIAQRKYTHYSALLPEKTCLPTRSGNYILKVYKDSDTTKTVFTKKIIILEEKISAAGQIVQPLNYNTSLLNQRIIVRLNTQGLALANAHQQLKLVVMQNQRWDNSFGNILPTFVRGKDIEYNTEANFVFQAGREWRWLDLRSFRFLSDRIGKGTMDKGGNTIVLRTDASRKGLRYQFFQDLNGLYTQENIDNVNPYWQSDYANVNFSYQTPDGEPVANKALYVIGKMTNYELNERTKLKYNSATRKYETMLRLKQGFYNYQYLTVEEGNQNSVGDISTTEGNFWETENTYQILIYYKPFGARVDEVVGFASVNSLNGRIGQGYLIQ
jgi:hypothetical protein